MLSRCQRGFNALELARLASGSYRRKCGKHMLAVSSSHYDLTRTLQSAPHGSDGSYLSIRAAAYEPRTKHCGRIR